MQAGVVICLDKIVRALLRHIKLKLQIHLQCANPSIFPWRCQLFKLGQGRTQWTAHRERNCADECCSDFISAGIKSSHKKATASESTRAVEADERPGEGLVRPAGGIHTEPKEGRRAHTPTRYKV
eukprot:6178355-Pleurochrysis_carterae.AAC.1